jgi:penicillin-binding protein 2
MQTTILQLAAATATLANRGHRFMPYLLLGEQMPGKSYIAQPVVPLEPIDVTDKHQWDLVINAMQNVVSSPQGTAFRYGQQHPYTIAAYTIAAKTGTAQVVAKRANIEGKDNQSYLPERLHDHHLFIAFAPIDHPKIAIAIITENSNTAVETTRAIFDYYLTCPQDKRSITAMLAAKSPNPTTCKPTPQNPTPAGGVPTNVDRPTQTQAAETAT